MVLIIPACGNQSGKKDDKKPSTGLIVHQYSPGSFGFDLEILENHHKIILLSDTSGKALAAVSPDWQGRVMTSSFNGKDGISLGWINHEFILSKESRPDMHPFGGEDRFWLGPEGGQFSLFFKQAETIELSSWKVPEVIDTEPFETIDYTNTHARFRKSLSLVNFSGHTFNLLVERDINLLTMEQVSNILGTNLTGLESVSFESVNTITNTGNKPWNKDMGALSIWILGMFQASDSSTVVIPFKKGDISELGPVVNDHYFVKIPPERLIVKDDIIFFKGDGKFRCKLGVSPKRALPFLGTYDARTNVLTVININLPENNTEYVNSLLEIRDDPFSGDVYNSYNDGPTKSGDQYGSYFELETLSPAAFLSPGESITHIHRTIHLTGERKELDEICLKIFGTSIDKIENAFQ